MREIRGKKKGIKKKKKVKIVGYNQKRQTKDKLWKETGIYNNL